MAKYSSYLGAARHAIWYAREQLDRGRLPHVFTDWNYLGGRIDNHYANLYGQLCLNDDSAKMVDGWDMIQVLAHDLGDGLLRPQLAASARVIGRGIELRACRLELNRRQLIYFCMVGLPVHSNYKIDDQAIMAYGQDNPDGGWRAVAAVQQLIVSSTDSIKHHYACQAQGLGTTTSFTDDDMPSLYGLGSNQPAEPVNMNSEPPVSQPIRHSIYGGGYDD